MVEGNTNNSFEYIFGPNLKRIMSEVESGGSTTDDIQEAIRILDLRIEHTEQVDLWERHTATVRDYKEAKEQLIQKLSGK